MAYARTRRGSGGSDYWPGFVDAMATLLLVVTFLLSLFMLAQYFATQEASGKDTALRRLTQQIAQLTELLALEKSQKRTLEESLSSLQASLATSNEEKKRLQGLVGLETEKRQSAGTQISSLNSKLDAEKKISTEALAKVELLNQQLLALRRQLAAIQTALEASEAKDKKSQARIADLGKRLNAALARKVQQLSRYRSDFFGRLREVLSKREGIKVVGDRFVFQAEVLFPSGSDQINPVGETELDKLAEVLLDIQKEIPKNINWVLRVDGHTDTRPINSAQFPSNWELSSARAISVVRHLIDRGVPAKNLVAAGFGEFQPLDPGISDEAFSRNRRIELKLTER